MMLTKTLLVLLLSLLSPAHALSPGEMVSNANIRDASDNPATIPNLGKKVLAIFYTDPDVSDQNDPFADDLKAADFDSALYQGMGIANLAEAPMKPNMLIRAIIRKKIAKYDSVILTDPDRILARAWNLGECNDLSVVVIIDKDRTVRFVKKGAMTTAERAQGVELVRSLIQE